MEPSIDGEAIQIKACRNCYKYGAAQAKFCRHCGAIQEELTDHRFHRPIITALIIFYAIELIICLIIRFNDEVSGWRILMVADAIMASSAIIFFAFIWDDVKHLLRWNNFSVKKVVLYAGSALIASFAVSWLVSTMNISLFQMESYYFITYIDAPYPKLFMILMTALSPALFEELAYRGFILGGLLKLMDSRSAIFITAFVFALIHLSLLSFFWLFPFALALGYIRLKENTIWYGVLIHFCFNALVCLLEFKEMGELDWLHF